MIMQQGEDGEGEEGGSERVEGEGGEEDWVAAAPENASLVVQVTHNAAMRAAPRRNQK